MNYSRISGFTLVEIISVLVIVGVLSAVALPDFFNLQERIRHKMIDNVIKDLNKREHLFWSMDAASSGDHDDEGIFNSLRPDNLGAKFSWSSGPTQDGGIIAFGPIAVDVRRTPSSSDDSGYWTRVTSTHYTISLDDGLLFGTSGWSSSFLNGSYAGSSPNILIPASMDGVTLTRVWQDVFNDKGLVSISFQNESQIEHIHARAFRNNNLTEVVLPETLKRIDRLAFDGNNITSVVIPDSVTTIETSAFTGLEKITVGSNLNFHTHPQGNESQLNNSINGNNAFRDAYVADGGGAGTYTWNGSTWVKE